MNGKGTVKSCMFSGFKQEKLYVQRAVKAFEQLLCPTAVSVISIFRPVPIAVPIREWVSRLVFRICCGGWSAAGNSLRRVGGAKSVEWRELQHVLAARTATTDADFGGQPCPVFPAGKSRLQLVFVSSDRQTELAQIVAQAVSIDAAQTPARPVGQTPLRKPSQRCHL